VARPDLVNGKKKSRAQLLATMAPKITSVKVSPRVLVIIATHAGRHRYSSVGGFLLGTSSENVTGAIPVVHGPLTQPIIDIALSLLDAETVQSIVGWYTAPRLLMDAKPDAVSLRVAAQLANDELEPVLLFVQNVKLCKFMEDTKAENICFVQGLGRNFGNQWLEEIATTVEPQNEGKVIEAISAKLPVNDLLDHFQDINLAWFPNKKVEEFLVSHQL
jgi:Uncharacterised protein family (UPF0172)